MARLQDNASFLQALDDNGDALSGALWKTYEANSTTPVTTYSDSGMASANAWPVVAPSSGRWPSIYVPDGDYKVRLETSAGALIHEEASVRAGPLGGKITQVIDGNETLVFKGGGINDDFSPWANAAGVGVKFTGEHTQLSGLPLVSVVDHQAAADTPAFPTAFSGYARTVNDGNTVFGGFFRADIEGADDGIPVGVEINSFNHGNSDADKDLFPNRAIGAGALLPAALQVAAGYEEATLASGVRRDSTYGVLISSEGGSVVNADGDRARFKYAIFVKETGFTDAGLVLISDDELDANGRHILLIDTQDSATGGPTVAMRCLRNAGVGAQTGDAGQAGDMLGRVSFEGNNSTPELRQFAFIDGEIVDPTSTSEDGKLVFKVRRGGVGPTEKATIEDGLVVGGGADRGNGTVNAVSGFYIGDVGILAGNGSPEGVVDGVRGATYHRKDGGAGTSYYVKESGTGNTGWVAK